MIGAVIGLVCGAAALFCLTKVTNAVIKGESRQMLLPLVGNMAALGGGLLITALTVRGQILHAGIAMSAVMVIGSFYLFLHKNRTGGGNDG